MKILILTNKLPYPPRDGGSIATLNMMKGLHSAGNQITCLSLNTKKHPFPVEQIPGELKEAIRFIGVSCNSSIRPLHLLGNLLLSREPYIASRFRNKTFRKTLAALLREEEFDVIQLEGPYPGLYLDQVHPENRARISLRAHNVEYLIWEQKTLHEKSLLKKSYLRNMAGRLKRFELKVARGVDMVIPISEPDAIYFREHQVDKPMLTIPVGINLEDYPRTELPDETSISFIGALDWLPNQEGLSWFLRKVFPGLLSELPDLRFHVAGRNAPSRFEKELRHPNITYHGEVENAQAFILSHRLMVAPLLTGSGIRVKILESLALERPVVTTSRGIEGIPEPVHTCVAVEDDPGLYASRLLTLLHEPQEQVRMGVQGRKFIGSYFDSSELSERLSQFYKTGA